MHYMSYINIHTLMYGANQNSAFSPTLGTENGQNYCAVKSVSTLKYLPEMHLMASIVLTYIHALKVMNTLTCERGYLCHCTCVSVN